MTLLDAFRDIGPVIEQAASPSDIRAEACGLILEELRRLSGVLNPAWREDAAMDVCARLIRSGPRGVRTNDPRSDEDVRRYLAKSLRNQQVSYLRRTNREEPIEEITEVTISPEVSIEEAIDQGRAREALLWARRRLDERVVPAIAAQLRDRRGDADGFLRAIADLHDIADGRVTMAAILVRDGAEQSDRAAARVYQQHSRARARLFDWMTSGVPAETIDRLRRWALKTIVCEMQARRTGAGLVRPGEVA